MMACDEMSEAHLEQDLWGKENDDIVGKRVRFRATNDPRSKLRFNDFGTIAAVTSCYIWSGGKAKLWIKWDKDDNYTLWDKDNFDLLDIFEEVGI